jgi:hypothetical protein
MSKLAELLAHRAATPATSATDGYLESICGVESSKSSSRSRAVPSFEEFRSADADGLREAREERAAILEYDGGLPRAEAERRTGLGPESHVAAAVAVTP